MDLTNRQYMQICSALNNTLEKTKAHIRRTNEIPPAKNVFSWFQKMCEYKIVKDKEPIDASQIQSNKFETIFFFNKYQVHLLLEFENREFRGHPYFDVSFYYTFIEDLNPDDYYDDEKLRYLKKKFNIKPL